MERFGKVLLWCVWLAVAGLGGAPPAARADALTGFVDSIGPQGAVGWACIPGSGQAVAIELFAGGSLLGVYPANLARSDVARTCGGQSGHGFAVWFDPLTRESFYGEGSLTAYAVASGGTGRLLPASGALASDPAFLMNGAVSGLDAQGQVAGSIASPGAAPPSVRLFAGGPLGGGGTEWGQGDAVPAGPGMFGFAIAPIAREAQPVFAYATDASGVTVPLAGALPTTDPSRPGLAVGSPRVVAQSGARSGITNTVLTDWVPAGMGFTGLSGTVTFAGNAPGFSEALVTVGMTADDLVACLAKNGTWPTLPPGLTRLWAGILKNTQGGGTRGSVPVSFALPFGVAVAGAGDGTCLTTLVSAGYAFLDAGTARYTTTQTALITQLLPLQRGAPQVVPLGLGGEFSFTTGGAQPLTTLVGIRAARPLLVDGIAASVSASAVAGAPPWSKWLPPPSWLWTMDTQFVAMPATACASLGLSAQPSNGLFSVMRQPVPAPFSLPAGSTLEMDLALPGLGSAAIQRTAYQAFAIPGQSQRSTLALATGDCLFAVHTILPGSSGQPGVIDFENQSTVYLRVPS